MSKQILFGEPQCWDFEHSVVNASLIHTALLAYPDSRIVFLAERHHQSRVHELLVTHAPAEVTRIEMRHMIIPPRRAKTLKRLLKEWFAFRQIMTTASREGCSLVFITSATEIGLLILKVNMMFGRHRIPVIAVLHGVLATLVPNAPRKRLSSIRGMRLVFRLPHPRQLSYLAYGSSILRSLREIHPKAADHTIDIELPFLWSLHALPKNLESPRQEICFGYFGASGGRGKGFDRFVVLAQRIRALRSNAAFTLVGHLSTNDDRIHYGSLFPDASPIPLTLEEYGKRAAQLTYALSLTDPDVYQVGASTSFLDALSYLKPGIYLRNRYIEECFHKMGDIGYLCDSPDEIQKCMLSVLDEFPTARYAAQCATILRMRRIFEPLSIAESLRLKLGPLWMDRS